MNILNLSYGMTGAPGAGEIEWSARERSIIKAARWGRAVAVKAAGNFGNNIEEAFVDDFGNERFDYLARDLAGLRTTIFVRALKHNGTASNPAIPAVAPGCTAWAKPSPNNCISR